MLFGIFGSKQEPLAEEPQPEVILPKGWDSKRGGYYPTEEELAEEEAIRQEYARTGFKDEPWKMALLKPRWSTDEDPPVNPFAIIQWDKHNSEFDEPVVLPYVEPGPPKPHFKRYIVLVLFLIYLSSFVNAYLIRRKKAKEAFFKERRRHGIPDDDLRPWPLAQADVIQRRHDRENLWRIKNGLAPLWDNENGVTIVLKEWDERGRPLPPKPTPEQIAQETWEKKFREERRKILQDKRARGAAFEHPGAFRLLDDDLFDDEIYVAPEIVAVPALPKTPERSPAPRADEKIERSKVVPAAPGERTRHRLPDPPSRSPPHTRTLHPAHTMRTDAVDAGPHNMTPLGLAAHRMRERWAWNLQAEEVLREHAIKYGHYIERPSHANPEDRDRPQTERIVPAGIPRRIDQSLVIVPDYRSMYGPQKKKSEKRVKKEKEREIEREQEALAQRATKKVKRDTAEDKTDVSKDKGKGKARAKDVLPLGAATANDAMDIDTQESKRGIKRPRDEYMSETGASEKEPARKRTKGPKGERAVPRAIADITQLESKKSPETATTQLESKKSPLTGKTTPPTIEDIATSPSASTVEPLDLDNMEGVRVDANGRAMRGDPCKGRKDGEEWSGRRWRMRRSKNERERLCAVVCQEKMRGFGLPADDFTVHLWLDDEKYAQAVTNQRLESTGYEAISVEPVDPFSPKNAALQKAGLNVLLGRKRSPSPPEASPKGTPVPMRSPPPISPPAESAVKATPANSIPEPLVEMVIKPPSISTQARPSPVPSSPPLIAVIAPTPPLPSSPVSSTVVATEKPNLPNTQFTPLGFKPTAVEAKNTPSTPVTTPFAGPSSAPTTVGSDFFARPSANPQPLSSITQSFRNPFQTSTTTPLTSAAPPISQSVSTPVKPPSVSPFSMSLGQSSSQQQTQHPLNPLAVPFTPPTSSPSAAQSTSRNPRFDASSQPRQAMPAQTSTQSPISANVNDFSFSFTLPSAPRLPVSTAPQWPTRSSPLANEILPDKPDVTVNQVVLDPTAEREQWMSKMTLAERDEFLRSGVPPLSLFLKNGVSRLSTDDTVNLAPPTLRASFASLSPTATQKFSTPPQVTPGISPPTPGSSGSPQLNPPFGRPQDDFTGVICNDVSDNWNGKPMFGKEVGNASAHALSMPTGMAENANGKSITYTWAPDGRRMATNHRLLKRRSNLAGLTSSNVSVAPQVDVVPTSHNAHGGTGTSPSTFTGFHQLAPTGPTLTQQGDADMYLED